MEIKCPVCKNKTDVSNKNSYRPFCSERCKLIDLGDWFSEKNLISENETALGILINEKPEEGSK